MILKLRVRLIFVSMISLFVVLALIIGSSAAVNYRRIANEADETLLLLLDNGGAFPRESTGGDGSSTGAADTGIEADDTGIEADSNSTEGAAGTGAASTRQDGTQGKRWNAEISPELPFESRFFSVHISETGEITDADTGNIAAIGRDTAAQYAKTVLENGKASGYIGNYRYGVRDLELGKHIVFLDCRRFLDSFQNSWKTICEISAMGMLAVCALISFFSKKIVKPVAESYEKQKRFITDAGHEIKTPLAIIDADANVLGIEMGENEWVNDIKSQIKRLTTLTNDLIYLSRMEESKDKMEMTEIQLSETVQEMAKSFETMAKAQEKTFRVQIQSMVTMKGDEKMIRQLVSVLLDNALKYCTPKGMILLTLRKQGHSITLSVFNTADSVKKSELNHIFDRFYRADQSRSAETGGHGIGLSIAGAVAAAHRGRISASTKDEKSLLIKAVFPV